MGKWQISKLILLETIFVGIISLVVGLVIGVFASQFMSVLVAKMFEADMSEFQLVFSKDACIKTCIYFAVMYLAVMIFNTMTVSRYKLINLLNFGKKNEKIKTKNPFIAILIFIVGAIILADAYRLVTVDVDSLTDEVQLLIPILMGIVGTVAVFWSLSGFILQVVQMMKKTYLKGTNMFVLRQINNKINTTVISMSVICIMLFLTITILSSSLALRNSMQKELIETTPVDIFFYKGVKLPETHFDIYGNEVEYSKEAKEDSKKPIVETLKNNGLDMNVLKDITEISSYEDENLTLEKFLGDKFSETKTQYPFLIYGRPEEIVTISDYNKIAKLYGMETYELKNDEYITICDFKNMIEIRNKVLANKPNLEIAGKEYKSKYSECKNGFINMVGSHSNTGIIVVPDNCPLTANMKNRVYLAANYNAKTDKEKEKIEELMSDENSILIQNLESKEIDLNAMSKIVLVDSNTGLATIITFVAIYLGIIFLIASSAILALKQLTESSDNKQRYSILRKIGCDEKMINGALFKQIGIFFGMPLLLAIIHSIFGIKFMLAVMSGIATLEQLLPSIIATSIAMGVIYGAYFLATYFESRNIIKEE